MMSIWPFLAARCRGLVPLGSVASPGRGSSKAAHMLLLRSNWTTWREGSGGAGSGVGGHGCAPPLPPLLGAAGAHRAPLRPLGRLTPTRPNSQARSRGVFPELSTMHGLDWCCSSISDCGATGRAQPPGRPGLVPPRRPSPTPPGAPHHIIVTMLGCQVQRDVALVGWDVHR